MRDSVRLLTRMFTNKSLNGTFNLKFTQPLIYAVPCRHLQIVAGMERFEYVAVYWILITETEAILKKKVPKIATGSF